MPHIRYVAGAELGQNPPSSSRYLQSASKQVALIINQVWQERQVSSSDLLQSLL
jgi:hypothetical protein